MWVPKMPSQQKGEANLNMKLDEFITLPWQGLVRWGDGQVIM